MVPVATITDTDIDAMLESMRRQQVKYVATDRASIKGDRVTVDFLGRLDGVAFAGGEFRFQRLGIEAEKAEDMLVERVAVADAPPFEPVETWPGLTDMSRLQKMIWAAERPVVVLGGSRWSEAARASVQRFAERFALPVATSFRRASLFDPEHACYMGDLGIGPNPKLLARVKAALGPAAWAGSAASAARSASPPRPGWALPRTSGCAAPACPTSTGRPRSGWSGRRCRSRR